MAPRDKLKFLLADGDILFANPAAFKKSPTIQNFLANNEKPNPEIQLPHIRGCVMKAIIRWCEHHIDGPTVYYEHDNHRPRPTNFDNQLMDECNPILIELILACTFLELMGLSDICAGKVAQNARGMDCAEMKRYFQLPSDSEDEGPPRRAGAAH